MTVKDYIKQLLSLEEYSFSFEELLIETGRNEVSIRNELSRLTTKKEVINLRKGFYLIITPRYSSSQKLPVQLYCEKLFKYLNRKYYLGFYTAARFYGASHQQTQRDYIAIECPKHNDIQKGSIVLQFFTTSNWPKKNIVQKQSDAGLFNISSPALTAVDLIHHQSKLGGTNRILANIEELSEEISESDLTDLLSWYPHTSTLQRLGFILDEIGATEALSSILSSKILKKKVFPVLLMPKSNHKPGSANNRWKVDANIKLESDL